MPTVQGQRSCEREPYSARDAGSVQYRAAAAAESRPRGSVGGQDGLRQPPTAPSYNFSLRTLKLATLFNAYDCNAYGPPVSELA